jgi:hypothetical protein
MQILPQILPVQDEAIRISLYLWLGFLLKFVTRLYVDETKLVKQCQIYEIYPQISI